MTAPDWLTEAQVYLKLYDLAEVAQNVADPTRYTRLSKTDRADFLFFSAVISGLATDIGDDALQELMAAVFEQRWHEIEIEAAA